MTAYRNQPNRRFNNAAAADTALVAFAVEDREDGKSHWTRIGRMFAHSDGKGYVVLLSAVPLDKRIVIREETPRPYNGKRGYEGEQG